jgi:hypothetical protein
MEHTRMSASRMANTTLAHQKHEYYPESGHGFQARGLFTRNASGIR